MEVLFENVYTRDEECVKDFYQWHFFKKPIRIVRSAIIAGIFAFFIFDAIMSWIVNGRDIGTGITICVSMLIVYAACLGLDFISYRKQVNLTLQRNREIHGKPIECTSRVTEQGITLHGSTGSVLQLNYADIAKVINTDKYIYLLSKSKLFYTFKKDSFVLGTPEAFLAFLQGKNIKV